MELQVVFTYSICVMQQISLQKSTFFICNYGTLTYNQQMSIMLLSCSLFFSCMSKAIWKYIYCRLWLSSSSQGSSYCCWSPALGNITFLCKCTDMMWEIKLFQNLLAMTQCWRYPQQVSWKEQLQQKYPPWDHKTSESRVKWVKWSQGI